MVRSMNQDVSMPDTEREFVADMHEHFALKLCKRCKIIGPHCKGWKNSVSGGKNGINQCEISKFH